MNPKFRAVALLVGTTIGAGIFGIPYVTVKAGFWFGIGWLILLALVTLFLNLAYSEVILRTPGDHQLTGYAKIYLGEWGKFLGVLAMVVGLYGSLLAYIIQVGKFLSLIFALPNLSFFFSLLFFSLASLIVFFGLRLVSWTELLLVGFIVALTLLVSFFALARANLINFQLAVLDFKAIFVPYGVILFALTGSSVIPEMEEILRDRHSKLKEAVIWGTVIPAVIYLVFVFGVVGLCGTATSPDAISGMRGVLPLWVVDAGAVLGILAMSTSFLTLGFVLREMYHRDFNLPESNAWMLAVFPPLLLFLFATQDFIRVLGITGSLMGGVTGILIMVLHGIAEKQGKLKPRFRIRIPLLARLVVCLLFLLGILWHLF